MSDSPERDLRSQRDAVAREMARIREEEEERESPGTNGEDAGDEAEGAELERRVDAVGEEQRRTRER